MNSKNPNFQPGHKNDVIQNSYFKNEMVQDPWIPIVNKLVKECLLDSAELNTDYTAKITDSLSIIK